MSAPSFSLEGQVALVTGAGRGLGRAIALGLAGAGADLVLAARSADQIDAVAAEARALGRAARAVPTDVADAASVEALFAGVDRLDVLVNNAGISPYYRRAEQLAEAEWRQVLDVNLTGTFMCCRAAAARLAESGAGSSTSSRSARGSACRAWPRTARRRPASRR